MSSNPGSGVVGGPSYRVIHFGLQQLRRAAAAAPGHGAGYPGLRLLERSLLSGRARAEAEGGGSGRRQETTENDSPNPNNIVDGSDAGILRDGDDDEEGVDANAAKRGRPGLEGGEEKGGTKRHCSWEEGKNAATSSDGSVGGAEPRDGIGHQEEGAAAGAPAAGSHAKPVAEEPKLQRKPSAEPGFASAESSPGRATPTLLEEENTDVDFSGCGDSFEDDEQPNALDEAQRVANDDAEAGKPPAPQLAQPGEGDGDSTGKEMEVEEDEGKEAERTVELVETEIEAVATAASSANAGTASGELVGDSGGDARKTRSASKAEAAAAEPAEGVASLAARVDGLKVHELRAELGRRGLDAQGRKPELQQRLREHLASLSGGGVDTDNGGAAEAPVEEEAPEGRRRRRSRDLRVVSYKDDESLGDDESLSSSSSEDSESDDDYDSSGGESDDEEKKPKARAKGGKASTKKRKISAEAAAKPLREAAYAALDEAYPNALAQVQRSHANLPLAEQRSKAAKLVQLADDTLLKAVWKKWKQATGSNVGFAQWKISNPLSANNRRSWAAAARQKLGWGIVDASGNTTRSLGDTTSTTEASALGTAQANLKAGLGLVLLFVEFVEEVWPSICYLERVRDRTSRSIPREPDSISSFFANNQSESIHMAIVDFDSSQYLLEAYRGANLEVEGKVLFQMTDEAIGDSVEDLLKETYRSPIVEKVLRERAEMVLQLKAVGEDGAEAEAKVDAELFEKYSSQPIVWKCLFERHVRVLLLKWNRHQLHWSANCFDAKKCGLLTTLAKLPVGSRGRSRRRGGKQQSKKIKLPAAHFPGPKKGEPLNRFVCPGQMTNHYDDGCTNLVPMQIDSNVVVCLSIPALICTDAAMDASTQIKEDEATQNEYCTVVVGDSLRIPDCTCKVCNNDLKSNYYTAKQHRFNRIVADHNGVGKSIDGFDPATLERALAQLKDLVKLAREGGDVGAYETFLEKVVKQCDSDTDHCVGRSEEIYNSIYATFPCSHSMNCVLAWIRIIVGDWCYGLSVLKYEGGNA